MTAANRRGGNPDRDERISLAGLDPEDALKALLKVDPEAEPVKSDEDPGDHPEPYELAT